MALKKFLETVYDRYCLFYFKSYIIDQIHQGVEEVVQIIANSIGEDNDLLEISNITRVGSYSEGTKIGTTNEFDFMVCLDRVSNPNAIDIRPGCTDGFKVVFIKDKTLNELGMRLYGDCWCLCKDEIRRLFIDSLERVIANLRNHCLFKANGQMVIESSTYLTVKLVWRHFSPNFLSSTQYCKMKEATEQSKCLFPCEMEESDPSYGSFLKISVDFMPCLMIDDVNLVTDLEYFPTKFKDLVQKTGCHIVLKACEMETTPLCMQISFASSEVFLMKNLHKVHIQCYKILKYLLIKDTNLNKPFKCLNLSSYTLKMAMLHHQYEGLCDQPPELTKCIFSVIEYLSDGFRKGVMPTFFMRNLNAWGATYKVPVFENWMPEGIDENNCCGVFWSQILWLEFWRQILKKAQNILIQIQNLDISDLLKKDDKVPNHSMENDDNPSCSMEKNNNPYSSIEKDNSPGSSMKKDNNPSRSMYKDNSPGNSIVKDNNPSQNMDKDNNPGSNMDKDNNPGNNMDKDNTLGQSMEKGCANKLYDITGIEIANSCTNITSYMNTRFDIYLEEFEKLKRSIVTVCRDFVRSSYGPRTENLRISPPNEEMLNLVLPMFDEYFKKILKICEIPNFLTTDNPEDRQDGENVTVLYQRQSSNL